MSVRRFSLKTLLTAGTILVVVLPVAALSLLSSRQDERQIMESALQHSQLLARGLASEYEQFLTLHLQAVRALAADAGAQAPFSIDTINPLLRRHRAVYGTFTGYTVVDHAGTVMAAVPPTTPDGRSALGISLADHPWFKDIVARREARISRTVIVGTVSGLPTVTVDAPVFDRSGRLIGAVSGGLDLAYVRALAERVRFGKTGSAVTTTAGGIALAHVSRDVTDSRHDYSVLPIWASVTAGDSGQVPRFVAASGEERLAGFATVPGVGWKVWVNQARSEVNMRVHAAYRRTLAWTAVSALAASALAFVVALTVSRPLRALRAGANAIAGGDFDQRAPEGGAAEVVELARTFNRMADSLKARIEAERAASARLQEASRLKSEFLANMSHELRTPLNGVIGFTEFVHDGRAGPVSAEQQEYLGDVLSSGRHLALLIDDVLDVARIDAGRMVLRPLAVEVVPLVADVVGSLAPLAAQKRIVVATDVDPAVAHVVTDASNLRKIVHNYLSNAIKFTENGGRVTVGVRREGDAAFRVEVIDTGIGVAPEDVDQLFVAFRPLDASVSKRQAGTGLGLALTRRLVEAQGGQVGVRTAPGEGSTFFAVLPTVVAQEAVPTRSSGPARGAGHGRPLAGAEGAPAILVVDDDPHALKLSERALRELGYRAVCRSDVEGALQAAAEDPPAAVVLDLVMPELDGFEFLNRFRVTELGRRIPVIVWTVKSLTREERQQLRISAQAVVEKSTGVGALVDELRSHLDHVEKT